MAQNDGGATFPSDKYLSSDMSLRDWFAGQALAGLTQLDDITYTNMARSAYQIADAMLKTREE